MCLSLASQVLEQGQTAMASGGIARRRLREGARARRRLQGLNSSIVGIGASNTTLESGNDTLAHTPGTAAMPFAEQAAEQARLQTVARSRTLMVAERSLVSAIGGAMVPGERAVVTSRGLTIGVAANDPCDPSAVVANCSAPRLASGLGGSFSMAPGTLCLHGQNTSSGSLDGTDGVQTSLALFAVNPYSAAASNTTGTATTEVRLSQHGVDLEVRGMAEPMSLQLSLTPDLVPSAPEGDASGLAWSWICGPPPPFPPEQRCARTGATRRAPPCAPERTAGR